MLSKLFFDHSKKVMSRQGDRDLSVRYKQTGPCLLVCSLLVCSHVSIKKIIIYVNIFMRRYI